MKTYKLMTMNALEIAQLIERYYDGMSTAEEENRLYFHLLNSPDGDKYPEVLKQMRAMRRINADVEGGEELEERLLSVIGSFQAEKKKAIWSPYRWAGIAAAVVLFFALWIGSELVKPTPVYGTITDPVKAFNETNKILGRVSTEMNKGLDPVQQTSEKMINGVAKVGNNINKADKSQQVDRASQYLKSFTRVYVNLGK